MSMSIQHINPADATNATTINDAHSVPPGTPSFMPELINISASGLADQDGGWEGVRRVVPSMDVVVKVFCVHSPLDLLRPWQRNKQYHSSSSGVVIGSKRILTNAHSVDHQIQVKVMKWGSDTKFLATVLAIGNDCDIAMLTVSDDKFWEGTPPVKFGGLPARQDAVTVVGYPIGGDTISMTRGVVSRMEILAYVHGSAELLGMQTDAAINPGNSGGPAFNDKGECVGIAFQSLGNAENIGYVIPVPVVTHFILDYEKNGAYIGFPILGIEWQKMENRALCNSVGMKRDQKGIRVRVLKPSAPESQLLKPSDVILSFDGVNIASDGTVPFRDGERIGFSHLVSQKYMGDNALVKVIRNFETLEFNIKLAKHKELIPSHIEGKPPFYIIAGFVFTVLSLPYLRSGVLAADINIGYEDIVNKQVRTFNDMPVDNLKSLASMVENCDDEYLKFRLEYNQLVGCSAYGTCQGSDAGYPHNIAYHCPCLMILKTKANTSKEISALKYSL